MRRGLAFLGVVAVLIAGSLLGACGGDGDSSDGAGSSGLPLGVSLEIDGDEFDSGEAITATVTLTNESDETLTVLRPFQLPAPVIFIVTNGDGVEAGYEGIFGERKPAPADRFVELKPGDSTEESFKLTDGYFLPTGEYTVIARYSNVDDGSAAGVTAYLTGDDDHDSGPVTIEVK